MARKHVQEIDGKLKDFIENNPKTVFNCKIDGQVQTVINPYPKFNRSANYVLLTNLVSTRFSVTGPTSNELKIKRAYSAIAQNKCSSKQHQVLDCRFYDQTKYSARILPDFKNKSLEYTMNVSNVYLLNQQERPFKQDTGIKYPTSINIQGIQKLVQYPSATPINLLSYNHVDDIIAFQNSAYWVRCQGKSGKYYNYTVAFQRVGGSLQIGLWYGQKKYLQLYFLTRSKYWGHRQRLKSNIF